MHAVMIAARSLLKSPAFLVVSLCTVALGIGVNTAMYSVVDALLFRGIPYPHSEQLVRIVDVTSQGESVYFSRQELDEITETGAFAAVGGGAWRPDAVALPNRPAEQIQTVNVTPHLFNTLGVQPMLGRTFTTEELMPGHHQVAILSYDYWQRRFGGQREVVGRTMQLSGEPATVIGVMPPSADFRPLWGQVDAWRPIHMAPDLLVRDIRLFMGLARLKSGTTIAQAEAQLKTLAARLAHDYPQLNGGHSYRLVTVQSTLIDDNTRRLSWMLLGLAGFVLLIACANLASLQLARATTNSRELAIRSALGASRRRLVAHQLKESIWIILVGGALGLILAQQTMALMARNRFISGYLGDQLRLNGTVLTVALVFCSASLVLFGLIPAWLSSRTELSDALKSQGRTATAGRSRQRMQRALIVLEFALALTLLAGASVMIHGFDKYFSRDHGWDIAHLLVADYAAPEATRYNVHEKRRALHRKLEQRLHEIPGIENAVITNAVPIGGLAAVLPIRIDGKTSLVQTEQPVASYVLVTNEFFAALKIPLREGNLFPPNPPEDDPQLIVINESMAHHFWPGESAIGKRVASWNQGQLYWREIIGVVGNVELAGSPGFPGFPFQIYRPLVQEPWMSGFLILRADNPGGFKKELERAVTDVDPDISVGNILTVPEMINQGLSYYQLLRTALITFAAIGLVLAAVGLYGVISHFVARRTSEFGIRLALGAQPHHVFQLVLGIGARLATMGFLLGITGATMIGRVLASQVEGLEGTDVKGIIFVSALLYLVAAIASWWPARRATRVDPLAAIRTE